MDDLTEISDKFDDVKNIRSKINISFSEIDAKIASLKLIYKDVSEKHTQAECTLGVDSLYFQNELISREFKNLQLLFDFINNRIYCEYYKLNSMIQSYIKNDLKSQELIKKTKTETVYPPYKSLDPLKVYDFSLVIQLFNQIVDLLNKMNSHIKNQDDNLVIDQTRLDMGLNIDNVINSQTYVNTILREKCVMFRSYLSAFQRHHLKYLNRLDKKVDLVLAIIHDDISLGSSKKTDTASQKKPTPKPTPNPKDAPKAETTTEPNTEPNTEPKAESQSEPSTNQNVNTKEPHAEDNIAREIVEELVDNVVNKMENDNIKVVVSEEK